MATVFPIWIFALNGDLCGMHLKCMVGQDVAEVKLLRSSFCTQERTWRLQMKLCKQSDLQATIQDALVPFAIFPHWEDHGSCYYSLVLLTCVCPKVASCFLFPTNTNLHCWCSAPVVPLFHQGSLRSNSDPVRTSSLGQEDRKSSNTLLA